MKSTTSEYRLMQVPDFELIGRSLLMSSNHSDQIVTMTVRPILKGGKLGRNIVAPFSITSVTNKKEGGYYEMVVWGYWLQKLSPSQMPKRDLVIGGRDCQYRLLRAFSLCITTVQVEGGFGLLTVTHLASK